MAGRPSQVKRLGVWMNGELVGYWTTDSKAHSAFVYASSWFDSPNARPLSLSIPLVRNTKLIKPEAVYAYFDNLLPDNPAIRKHVARRYQIPTIDAFDLLSKLGRDCIGAVQLLPEGDVPTDVKTIKGTALSEKSIISILDSCQVAFNTQLSPETDLRLSLAGAQEKTALLWHQNKWMLPEGATPTTHILKLPMGEVGRVAADFSLSVENEWLCSRIIDAYGIPVAHSEILRFGDYKVLSVARFDRKLLKNWIARLPQEDFCQVLSVPHISKYEEQGGPGIETILQYLLASTQSETDRIHFLKAQLLFWILAATDGHAKNFSIQLLAGGDFKLAPLYDVMSIWPIVGNGSRQLDIKKAKMAMGIKGTSKKHYRIVNIHRRHWNHLAKIAGLGLDFESTISQVIEDTPLVLKKVSAQLPKDFPLEVAEPIFNGIRDQIEKLKSQF